MTLPASISPSPSRPSCCQHQPLLHVTTPPPSSPPSTALWPQPPPSLPSLLSAATTTAFIPPYCHQPHLSHTSHPHHCSSVSIWIALLRWNFCDESQGGGASPKASLCSSYMFEAGKPLEFVACGSNLLQSKFRFLVSFAGKYLVHDYCVASLHCQTEGDTASSCNHQMYKIYVPQTEPALFGPAFIEVENESGLSNFIPILIGDKEICAEMEILQRRFYASLFLKGSEIADIGSPCDSFEFSAMRQSTFSEFLLDVAWLLKEPASESFQQSVTASQIQRFNSLLNFLICYDSTTILDKLLEKLKIVISDMKFNSTGNGSDADLSLLQKHIGNARHILHKKYKKSESSVLQSGSASRGNSVSESCSQDNVLSIPINSKDTGIISNSKLEEVTCSTSTSSDRSETVPLLNREVIMNVNHVKEWPRKSCGGIVSRAIFSSRPSIFLISIATVCLGICAVVLHPHKVSEFAVSIRRCLFDRI
ncbi:hypothetical protein SLA2020_444240 [Shorea laevis]